MASLMTGKKNSIKQIAASLGPDAPFVKTTASPLVGDEESAVEIQYIISVDINDVEMGHALLYERIEQLSRRMGEYAVGISSLPEPATVTNDTQPAVTPSEEDFDLFEEPEESSHLVY